MNSIKVTAIRLPTKPKPSYEEALNNFLYDSICDILAEGALMFERHLSNQLPLASPFKLLDIERWYKGFQKDVWQRANDDQKFTNLVLYYAEGILAIESTEDTPIRIKCISFFIAKLGCMPQYNNDIKDRAFAKRVSGVYGDLLKTSTPVNEILVSTYQRIYNLKLEVKKEIETHEINKVNEK